MQNVMTAKVGIYRHGKTMVEAISEIQTEPINQILNRAFTKRYKILIIQEYFTAICNFYF